MHKVTSRLLKIRLQRLSRFLAGMALLIGLSVSLFGYAADAAPSMVVAQSYRAEHTEAPTRANARPTAVKTDENEDGLVESIKDTADNVREKLNLDQPLPESTKAFFKQVKGEDVTVEEPRPFGKGGSPQNN